MTASLEQTTGLLLWIGTLASRREWITRRQIRLESPLPKKVAGAAFRQLRRDRLVQVHSRPCWPDRVRLTFKGLLTCKELAKLASRGGPA